MLWQRTTKTKVVKVIEQVMWVIKAASRGSKVTCVKVVAWVTKVAKAVINKQEVRAAKAKVVNVRATRVKVLAEAAREDKVSNNGSYSTATVHPDRSFWVYLF
jgi:hypothetical protein